MTTVRARTTALATVVAGLTLALASVGLVLVLDAQLTRTGDAACRARVQEIERQLTDGRLPAVLAPETDNGLVQVVAADGRVLAASPNVTGASPVVAPATTASEPRPLTLTGPDDAETERYRLWTAATPTDEGVVTIVVGTSLESVHEATARLRTALLVGVPLVLALLGLVTWWVVGRALGRVEAVRREVAAITEHDLSRRVEAGPPDEVGRLAATMNATLDRLEEGQQRQRAFVADASHELRSPLTAFRSQLEVAAMHPDHADWPAVADALLEDADRMERLVADLLLLAASEAAPDGRERPVALPIDLAEVVTDEVRHRGPLARVEVRAACEPAPARIQADHARRIVANLLDNAARHARSAVAVTTGVRGGSTVVAVSDDGPGVADADAPLIFERFHRGDPSRSRAQQGTGLGLPIARALARRYAGDVVLVGAAEGARFELVLPAVEPPRPRSAVGERLEDHARVER